jgi:rhamnosyltransferase
LPLKTATIAGENKYLERVVVLETQSDFTSNISTQNRETLLQDKPLGNLVVIIPTFNAAKHWPGLSSSLALQGVSPSQVLIIDSSSRDGTRELAEQSGYTVVSIPQAQFNHGGTRKLACSYFPQAERLLLCTQDVIFQGPGSIETLSKVLDDPSIGAAYGRQLPRPEANAIERHGRLFNYSQTSQVRSLESRAELGMKATFLSNSFAVYRRSALEAVGGFPSNVVLAEDSFVAARMLLHGWKTVYEAGAAVIHSHAFSLSQEASRYFDTGAHHQRERWIFEAFGNADSEGLRFIVSELRYLWSNAPHLIPSGLLRNMVKFAAYRLGHMERHFPIALKKKMSGYPQFWIENR